MKLKARQYIRYARKPYMPGSVFDAADSDACVLIAIGKAEKYVEPAKPKQIAAVFKPIPAFVPSEEEVELAKEEPKKRGYKRRDMVAE